MLQRIGFVGSGARGRFVGCVWLVGSLLTVSSARGAVVGFEDSPLAPESAYYGADGAGGFTSGGAGFNNGYRDWGGGIFDWWGWSYANLTDSTTPGHVNQFGVVTGGGAAASAHYGLGFGIGQGASRITLPAGASPVSLMVTNGTFPYYSMRDGDAFAKQFGGPTGEDPDYFRLTIEGLDGVGGVVGAIEFYLADFRFDDDAMDYIVEAWTEVDLTPLLGASELSFTLDSSDVGDYGMNTPAYFAIDNLVYIPEPATCILLGVGCLALVARRRNAARPEPRP